MTATEPSLAAVADSGTVVTPQKSSSQRGTVRWPLDVALLFSILFAAVVLWHFHDRFWWPPDEGAYAHVADRIVRGDVLNADVQDVHLGYVNFANALALRMFGDDLLSLRYPLVLMGVVEAGLVYWLFRPQGRLSGALASASITALSLVQFLNPTAHWYCLFLFVMIVALLTWWPRGSRLRLEAIGLLVATAVLFRQLSGVIIAIGVVTYLFAESPRVAPAKSPWLTRLVCAVMALGLALYLWEKTNPLTFLLYGIWPLGILLWATCRLAVANREAITILARVGWGGVIAALPLALYHIVNGSSQSCLNDTLISAESLTRLDFFRAISYPMLLGAACRQLFSPESGAHLVNGLFWIIALSLAPVLGMLVLCRALPSRPLGGGIAPLPFLAVFYSVVSLHYQIPIYLFYSLDVSLLAVLWLAHQSGPLGKYSACVLAVTLSAIGIYYHAGQPLSRGLVGTLSGDRIALAPSDGLERCSLWMEPADRKLYTHVVGLVRREVAPHETILALPFNPELYFLTARENPCRFFNVALGVRNEVELERTVKELSDRPPRLVCFRPEDKYNSGYSLAIMDWVKRRYELIETVGGFEIYRLGRKS